MHTSNPYEGLQDFVASLPEFVQPLAVFLAAMIPYVEGEGAVALGIIVGISPVVAALAAVAGNVFIVVLVVLLSARVRDRVVARRARSASGSAAVMEKDKQPSKGRMRLERWLVRFGVPGASLLAPLALPTPLTAAFFVASGVEKRWVILWQAIAIVLWTGLVAAAAVGLVSLLGW